MKRITVTIAILIISIAALTSCDGKMHSWTENSYSPLDTYINTTIQRSQDSAKEAIANRSFIDSINHNHMYYGK